MDKPVCYNSEKRVGIFTLPEGMHFIRDYTCCDS